MFIFWGEKHSETNCGVVADQCAHCGKLALMSVSRVYRKEHIYGISTDGGRLIGTVFTCNACGGRSNSTLDGFAQFLGEFQAGQMSMSEVLERTNPRLAQALAYRARFEQAIGPPDPRVQEAMTRLDELSKTDPRVHELRALLSHWKLLDPAAQAELLGDIEALVAEEQRVQAVRGFVRRMAQRFPTVDGLREFITFLGVAAAGITLAVKFLSGDVRSLGILAALGLAILLSVRLNRALSRRLHKHYFLKIFMPQAQDEGLHGTEILTYLRLIDPSTDGMRALVKASPLLNEILIEEWQHTVEPGNSHRDTRADKGPSELCDPTRYMASEANRRTFES